MQAHKRVILRASGIQDLSDELTVKQGVPQGSILGPVLFNIFIAHLGANIKHCNMHYYADDVQIMLSMINKNLQSIHR